MDYTSLDKATLADHAILTEPTATPWSSFPGRPRQRPEVLRYRGIVMNTITGSVLIQGRPTNLAVAERELLAALMRRSGQIVSPHWLASQIRATATQVEMLAESLASKLREAGASCLPRRVEGLGFVLWH
ncbi:MAG TPA: hypothetical protein VF812_08335 [Ktedonobacterales bacterium]